MAPNLIGLEEHFTGQAVLNRPSATAVPNHLFPKSVADNLADLAETRTNMMDRGNMSIQVVSHIPAVEPLEICREVSNQLFAAVKSSDGRLRGFAFLPIGSPDAIAQELERCVKELGFVGALIPNHAHGKCYDGKEYWPMFAKAEEPHVPIYI